MIRPAPLAAVAATTALALGGGAIARATHPTGVSFDFSGSRHEFHGRVSSDVPECVRGRKVTVFREQSGRDAKVGSDLSGRRGGWSLRPDGQPDPAYYYAKVATKRIGPSNIRCASVKSVKTAVS